MTLPAPTSGMRAEPRRHVFGLQERRLRKLSRLRRALHDLPELRHPSCWLKIPDFGRLNQEVGLGSFG